MSTESSARDLVTIGAVIIGWLISIWQSGRKIGRIEVALQKDLETTKLDVSKLETKVVRLESLDCVEEDTVQQLLKAGYLTRTDLSREQGICRRELALELQVVEGKSNSRFKELATGQEYIKEAITSHARSVNNIAEELRGLRDAILASGVKVQDRTGKHERKDDLL